MGKKISYKVIIYTYEQEVTICPAVTFDGVIIECKEMNGTTTSPRMYLNEDEMELRHEK